MYASPACCKSAICCVSTKPLMMSSDAFCAASALSSFSRISCRLFVVVLAPGSVAQLRRIEHRLNRDDVVGDRTNQVLHSLQRHILRRVQRAAGVAPCGIVLRCRRVAAVERGVVVPLEEVRALFDRRVVLQHHADGRRDVLVKLGAERARDDVVNLRRRRSADREHRHQRARPPLATRKPLYC